MYSDEIKDMALNFRKAIISLKQLPPIFSKSFFGKFPDGCCGETSELFMYHLLQKNIESEYWMGTFRFNDFSSTHAWLKIGEYYLDMTADQFNKHCDLNFSELILVKKDVYPLSIYLEDVRRGVGIKGYFMNPKNRYDLIIDVIKNGYSEKRILAKLYGDE